MQKAFKKQINNKSMGPLINLEEHVKPDWWKNLFNSLYLKTDNDVVEDILITRKEIDLFTETINVSDSDSILDLSCGQGRHSLELARRGYSKVEGLDRSRFLIQRARSQAKQENLAVKFREGDARKIQYPADTFDVVMILGNSFGYFESLSDDIQVLKEVFRVLKPWGRILIDICDGDYTKKQYQPRSWEWIDSKHFVCRERTLSYDKMRLISREVVTNIEKGVIKDQFYAERLYSFANMKDMLETIGFSDIILKNQINTESIKNQDLGMMEQRMLITAQVKKAWANPLKKEKKDIKNIVVILGDPNKEDPLKPLSIFDEDDFYTIDKMKDALRNLKQFNFIYLDNHDTLINSLRKLKNKTHLIFNLCDEGYNNDPKKELHIPTLLDILGIHYTGSGPQCLAFCYDKSLVRGIASEMSIPVALAFYIKPEDSIYNLPIPFPVIVKPNYGDSSFGITIKSVANNIDELSNAISYIRDNNGYDKPIIVEKFLSGKDLSLGIIGNLPDSYTVLPIIEEDYSVLPSDLPKICGYEAKWNPHSPYFKISSIEANLPIKTKKMITECSLKLFERLECRDYCRFDWRLDENGDAKLLEVNPNPGWCWDGHLAKMSNFAEISYTDMLYAIIKAAEERSNLLSKK